MNDELQELCNNQAAVIDALADLAAHGRKPSAYVQALISANDLCHPELLLLIVPIEREFRVVARLEKNSAGTAVDFHPSELSLLAPNLIARSAEHQLLQDWLGTEMVALASPIILDGELQAILYLEKRNQDCQQRTLSRLMMFVNNVATYLPPLGCHDASDSHARASDLHLD